MGKELFPFICCVFLLTKRNLHNVPHTSSHTHKDPEKYEIEIMNNC